VLLSKNLVKLGIVSIKIENALGYKKVALIDIEGAFDNTMVKWIIIIFECLPAG
jgi:hypothetical protein